MDISTQGSSIQNVYSPLMAGGKLAGNIGKIVATGNGTPFASIFQDAVANVENLDAIKSNDSYNLSIGNIDNIAEMMVNSERAQVSFQFMMQMRNKLLDSYSEIMRMNV